MCYFIKNNDVALDDVSVNDTLSHDMSLIKPNDIRLWALHFE